jgi:hypothetical protein
MEIILNPEPSIINTDTLIVEASPSNDILEYAVTTDGIPPVIAKYIAYDNLTPANPFIATVEDGLGNVLMDGGFPKWYDQNCNTSWTTFDSLGPAYKYFGLALNYIANPEKVAIGNKKILIIGDANAGANYNIKGAGGSNFNKSINKVCSIMGYTPTFKTTSDYGTQLDIPYSYLNEFAGVVFFSTVYTSSQLISNNTIQNLIVFRENGNGIFIITDHGESLANLDAAKATHTGFFRSANFLITNFGCYFTGNYDRSPVNVGYLRTNYGNHPLWGPLTDSEYIPAGGSESKVNITTYPLYTGSKTFTFTNNGYISIKFLLRNIDGSITSKTYTYGKNVPEILYFKKNDGTDLITFPETILNTFPVNFNIVFQNNTNGLIKINETPIGEFSYNYSTGILTKTFYSGNNLVSFEDNDELILQITSPLNYSKKITLIKSITKQFVTNNKLRINKILNKIHRNEFLNLESTSKFKNFNKFIAKNNSYLLNRIQYRLKAKNIINYF